MDGKYDVVLEYNPTDRRNLWNYFSTNAPAASNLINLRPGLGMWNRVTRACTWEVKGY